MPVSPIQLVSDQIQNQIQSAREGVMVSVDGSLKAARLLRSPAELVTFYNQQGVTEVNWVVATVTYMVSVAVGALTFAAGGHHAQLGDPLLNSRADMAEFSIEELLAERRGVRY